MPDIQNVLVDVYGPQGLEVAAIDNDPEDVAHLSDVAAFVNNQGVEFPVLGEDSTTPTYSQIAGIYAGSNPYPVDILVDKNGIMRYIAREYDPTLLEQQVQELLAE